MRRVREVMPGAGPGGLESVFVLTDIAGKHYWTGRNFLVVTDVPPSGHDLLWFGSRRAAEAERRRRLRQGWHFRVKRAWVRDAGRGPAAAEWLFGKISLEIQDEPAIPQRPNR